MSPWLCKSLNLGLFSVFLFFLCYFYLRIKVLKKAKNMTLEGCGVGDFCSLLQTDTASVLAEAIGYIRFLQNQIEVMFFFSFFLLSIAFLEKKKKPYYDQTVKGKVSFPICSLLFLFFHLFFFGFWVCWSSDLNILSEHQQALSLPYLGNGSGNVSHQQSV